MHYGKQNEQFNPLICPLPSGFCIPITAPGYSMRGLRDMGNPYEHAPDVSIVRVTLAHELHLAVLCGDPLLETAGQLFRPFPPPITDY
jgi:hypothetical protein